MINPDDLTIGVVTYMRPAELERLLDTIDRLEPEACEILVVDNDPAASARHVAGRRRVRYVHEAQSGVANARAKLLAECDTRWLASIDDDEEPLPGWTSALVSMAVDTGSGMVAGPVVPRFESPPDDWILASRVFDRSNPPAGTRLESIRGGNVLFDMCQIRSCGITYDPAFNTGGEDIRFSLEASKSGIEIVWTDSAAVVEHVRSERLTRRWVRQRWTSAYANYWRAMICSGQGNRSALLRRFAGKPVLALRALARGSMVDFVREVAHAKGALSVLRSR